MVEEELNIPEAGMSFKNQSTLGNSSFSLVNNGNVESFKGDSVLVSNESSNTLCSRLKGFKVLNTNLVPALGMTFYFLVNPTTTESEIGFIYDQNTQEGTDRTSYCSTCNNPIIEDTPLEKIVQLESCSYFTFVNANCLNFNINYPIQSWIKVDDCRVRIYFSDGLNPPRYIDYNSPVSLQNVDLFTCPLIQSNELDCSKINIFPTTCYPQLSVIDVVSGGQNQAGTYQFTICYSDVRSNKVTDYFHVTNPTPLFSQQITVSTNYPIAKSIKLQISNLNTDFQYLNLVVLKTVNNVTTPYLVDTLQINSENFTYLYTGIDRNVLENVSIDEVLSKRPLYATAIGVSESNGYLFLDQLTEPRILNLQSTMIDLPVYWQTVQLNEGDYKDPLIANGFTGYLGDETYAFGISFTRTNAQDTATFHIAGRDHIPSDFDNMSCVDSAGNPVVPCPSITNNDVLIDNTCTIGIPALRYQVYNTAVKLGTAIGFDETPIDQTVIKSCISQQIQINSAGEYSKDGINFYADINQLNLCVDCQSNLQAQYTGIEGITFQSIAFNGFNLNLNDPNSSINIITNSGVTQIPVYTDNLNLSLVPNNPYPYSPCISNPSGTAGSQTNPLGLIDVKFNQDSSNAVSAPVSPTIICIQDQGFPTAPEYMTFYNNIPTQSNTSKSSTPDLNRSWYSFIPTSNTVPIAVSIFTDNNPFIEIYDSGIVNTPTPSTYSTVANAFLNVSTDYSDQHYTLLNPAAFIIGNTYYIKVYGSITNPFSGDIRDCYFRICLTTPSPSSYTNNYSNIIATATCAFTIKYSSVLSAANPCSVPNYQIGLMSYSESTELYPCNPYLYGDLAGKPIRHHRFPDETISPFFQSTTPSTSLWLSTYKCKIYPKGFTISVKDIKERLYKAFYQGLITQDELNSICGYRIWRSDRRGEESIIGKGLLYDVWQYKDNAFNTGNQILFSNFPYNDNTPNIYLNNRKINNTNDINPNNLVKHPDPVNFTNTMYVFESPNLSFNNPGLGIELKIESEHYGLSRGTFQDVKNNATYQYIGAGIISAALGFASIEAAFEGIQLIASATLTIDVTVLGTGASIPVGLIVALLAENLIAPIRIYNYYSEWYDIISKFAPFRNYATYYQSVGTYDHTIATPNAGNKRRTIVSSEYVNPGILNIPTQSLGNMRFNNYNRESTCFIEVSQELPKTTNIDQSRWLPTDNGGNSWTQNNFKSPQQTPVCSYYGSMKNNLPNQYGTLDSITYLDTGFNGVIDWSDVNQDTINQTIFGGDTFINRFAKKRKVPFFLDDRVPTNTTNIVASENIDILLSEIPNIAYPLYFMDYPKGLDYSGGGFQLFGDVAVLTNTQADFHFLNYGSTGTSWSEAGLAAAIIGGLAGGLSLIYTIPIAIGIAIGAVKSDLGNDMFLEGKYLHSCYGIPYFLCESNYNLDYRYGQNYLEKDFYPHVADTVTWTQQTFVPINNDNFYFYDNDYSKPNKENFTYTLNSDFNQQVEDCKVVHPNRVIYSLQDLDQNDRYDGNLIFLANNYFDFPKSGGKISILRGIENNKVVVIQENQTSVYNSYVELKTNLGATSVGSNTLFAQDPAQYIKTDLGYGGSQTTAFISTEYGHFWIDNKRGQIINLSGGIKDIIKPEDAWWFKQNLPFKILKDFPDADVSNNYKYFGCTIAYDSRFKRVFFTKRDAELLPQWKKQVSLVNGNFYLAATNNQISDYYVFQTTQIVDPSLVGKTFIGNNGTIGGLISINGNTIYTTFVEGNTSDLESITFTVNNITYIYLVSQIISQGATIILPTDPTYFCNRSFTISYSPIRRTFTSFHSFTPNYYVSNQNYFQSGINYSTSQNDIQEDGLWNHLLTTRSYQVYYGTLYPYILEYSLGSKSKNKVLDNLEFVVDVSRFQDNLSSAIVSGVFFNKLLVYNQNQSTGLIELVVKEKNNMYQSTLYPQITNLPSTQVLVENLENRWCTNDALIDRSLQNGQPLLKYICGIPYKNINQDSLTYSLTYLSSYLRSDWFSIRLINDKVSNYLITNRFDISDETNSQI